MAKLTPEAQQILKRQHYEVVGEHSAVEICSWTKKSLLDRGICYKQKFYGINCHRCCQMSPAAAWCNHRCIFCWRAIEHTIGNEMKSPVDNPKAIVDGCINAQIRKLSGFKGNKKINMKKWREAQEPMHFAISLTGEPTLYPALPALIKEINSRGKTTFLVTNGTQPEMLQKLKTEGALPTQLYISLDAPNKELYTKLDRPVIKDGWNRINKTLHLLPSLNTRKVIRITLIKGLNDCCVKEYAELIRQAGDNVMIEVKGYMWIGYSRKRLKLENMPLHTGVIEFSEKLAKELGWKVIDESKPSRVALLVREDFPGRVMRFE